MCQCIMFTAPVQVPVGAGVALANQYLGTGGICVALYGDGAANQVTDNPAYVAHSVFAVMYSVVVEILQ